MKRARFSPLPSPLPSLFSPSPSFLDLFSISLFSRAPLFTNLPFSSFVPRNLQRIFLAPLPRSFSHLHRDGTHHGSPTAGFGFWHRAHRLVSRHPPSALRRTLALTPSPRAPRSQGFVMPPTGAVAVRSSALSTESPVMLFGAKKPAPKKVAKRPVKKARSLVKEVAGHSSLRHTPGASPINASALAGWLPRLGALACSHAVSSA